MIVNIKCSQKLYYDQEVEMSEEDFNKLELVSGDDINLHQQKEYSLIEKYLDKQDIFDEEEEFEDFEISKTNQ